MTSVVSFEDIFYQLNIDLETDANEWHLNNFYLNFEDEIHQTKEWREFSTDHQRQHPQSQVASISQNKVNNQWPFHEIPDYLLASSLSFRTTFFNELNSLSDSIDFVDLQQLAHLTHQMSIIHLHQQLWYYCLQSGTGQIRPREQSYSSHYLANITLSVWPEIVTSIMISKGIISCHTQDKFKHDIYVNFVQNYLQQLETIFNQCRLQFSTIQSRLSGYTDQLNDKIDHFVQKEGLITMRLHFQSRIALIKSISIDRSYQLEYFQQKPTDAQLQIAQHICHVTFDKENAEQELILFKVGVLYKKLPKSLDLLEVSLPISISTISDPNIRERLSHDYIRIIQRAKADLMMVLTTAAEVKSNDCKKIFDKETIEMWKNQNQILVYERLTTVMLTLIEQRQKNIIECVKHYYELKGNFNLTATPTSTISS